LAADLGVEEASPATGTTEGVAGTSVTPDTSEAVDTEDVVDEGACRRLPGKRGSARDLRECNPPTCTDQPCRHSTESVGETPPQRHGCGYEIGDGDGWNDEE